MIYFVDFEQIMNNLKGVPKNEAQSSNFF